MMVILVVDDNPEMRRMIRNVVGDLGDVYECSEGEGAVADYNRYQPDWVLMDIRLGAVNGIQATARITAADPDARIVIVTNYDDVELRHACARAGACDYVLKENLSEVRRILVRALDQPKNRTC